MLNSSAAYDCGVSLAIVFVQTLQYDQRMAKLIDVIAVYKLPASLQLSEGCFGKNLNISIAGMAGKATTPSIAWNKEDKPYIVAPKIDGELKRYVEHYITNSKEAIEKWHYWGNVSSWHPKKHVASDVYASALLIRFKIDPTKVSYSEYTQGRGHPQGKEINALFKEIDGWFERLAFWVEAVVDQDMSHDHSLSSVRMPGNGLSVFTVEGDIISLPAHSNSIILRSRSSEKLKLPTLRKIIAHANNGVLPSDAHMLLKESRAARRRGQYRRAVIDAGSATEITLADFNRRAAHVAPRPGQLPTLGWYVRQRAIAARAGLPANTIADLVDIRNRAIHQNLLPTPDETKEALAIAEQIVNEIDPLPT